MTPAANAAARDGQVAGGLVESEGEATAARTDEVDLHVHRHRPRQPLVQSEQRVRRDDPAPRRREDDDEGHGQPEQPSGDEDRPPGEAFRESAGEQIGERLRQPERRDERDGDGLGCDAELVLRQHRKDRPLQADHAADECVRRDEQRELLPVRAEAERGPGAPADACESCYRASERESHALARSALPNSAR